MFAQIFKLIAANPKEEFCEEKIREFGTCLEKTG